MSKPEADRTAVGKDGTVCVKHPEETAGPFPADGSNRAHGTLANALKQSGIVREDMRASFGNSTTVADGVTLDLEIKLHDVAAECAPLAGYAIYLWHCDAAGRYSIYNLENETYLRAVGVSDAQGRVAFRTILPGCYPGRYPHMHFEIYRSLEAATDYTHRLLTSQLAMPAAQCRDVYDAVAAYKASVAPFSGVSLETDGIFRDNTPVQLAAQTPLFEGDAKTGFKASVTIGLVGQT